MRYQITGYSKDGSVLVVGLNANNTDAARAQAEHRGFQIIEIKRTGWSINISASGSSASRQFNLLRFSEELLSLISAGLSIIEALNAISRKEGSTPKRQLIESLVTQIRGGKSFSSALTMHPDDFPPLYRALAAASEKTGHLGDALSRFIAYRVQMDDLKKKVVTSAIYPLILLLTGGLVMLFLMGYVVPRFSRIYEGFGRDIPWMSSILLSWGNLIGKHGFEMLLGAVVMLLLLVYHFRHGFRRQRWVSRIALLGPIAVRIHLFEIARFYRTVGLLLQGGIPLIAALDMARPLLGSRSSSNLLLASGEIRAGATCSDALERHQLAPVVAVDLLRTGEKTGALGDKMISIADFFDEDLARWAEWFSKLFEPILMLVMGLFIAFVVVLLYLPIFELANSLQ